MDSLRTRHAQPPRKAQRTPTRLVKNVVREVRKSRVDDKIKKRMSTRYAEISSPTELTSPPAMPAVPMPTARIIRGEPGREDEDLKDRSSITHDGSIAPEDKKTLSSEDFNADAFIKIKLANSTEAELKTLQSSLRSAKDDTASDLQRSVFKNYAEFVLISKEISVLENEMLELKDLLSEYRSMPSVLHIPDPTSTSTGILSTYKRSSVADLRILYFNQMQALHASIEGSAKFVPTTPGRHVISEMEGIYSLNAATYRVVGKVKFVILDDAVLVAKRRRRNAAAGDGSTMNEGKLVAEKCWPLNDMLVLDTKDSPNMTNVFKIRHGKETHVYRTGSLVDKKSLLAQFRQAADELAARRRKEREGEHERRKSMWQGGDRNSVLPPMPPMPEWMSDLAKKGGEVPGIRDEAKEKAESDAQWVADWSDDLIVAIALREWTKAVDLVEKGQARLPITPLLQTKLPDLKNQLTASLLASLSLPSNKKSTCTVLINLLVRLKAVAAARKTYLDMRTSVIKDLMRRIGFGGDIGSYVGDLSVIWFTGIKHTADWYLASFKDNESTSAFVVWAQERLKEFAEMFRRQVYTRDAEPSVVQEAIATVQTESRKLLREHGMDFKHVLDQLLVESPKEQDQGIAKFSVGMHRISKPDEPRLMAKEFGSSNARFQESTEPTRLERRVVTPRKGNDAGKESEREKEEDEKGKKEKEKGKVQRQRQPSPPPPTLSAPSTPGRRRSPAPPSSFRDHTSRNGGVVNSSTFPPIDIIPSSPPSIKTPQPSMPGNVGTGTGVQSPAFMYPGSPSYSFPPRSRTPVSTTPGNMGASTTSIDNAISSPPVPTSTPTTGLGSSQITGTSARGLRIRSPSPGLLSPNTGVTSGMGMGFNLPSPSTPVGASTVATRSPGGTFGSVRERSIRSPLVPPRSVNRLEGAAGGNADEGKSTVSRGVVPQHEGMI